MPAKADECLPICFRVPVQYTSPMVSGGTPRLRGPVPSRRGCSTRIKPATFDNAIPRSSRNAPASLYPRLLTRLCCQRIPPVARQFHHVQMKLLSCRVGGAWRYRLAHAGAFCCVFRAPGGAFVCSGDREPATCWVRRPLSLRYAPRLEGDNPKSVRLKTQRVRVKRYFEVLFATHPPTRFIRTCWAEREARVPNDGERGLLSNARAGPAATLDARGVIRPPSNHKRREARARFFARVFCSITRGVVPAALTRCLNPGVEVRRRCLLFR